MIKKADIFLGLFLIVLCLSSLLLLRLADGAGTTVTVTVDGELYGTYELSQDQRLEILQPGKGSGDEEKTGDPVEPLRRRNVVEIRGGAVFMAEADCSNQVCVHQGAIRRTNQTIVCLPNRVVVSISGAENGMDAVSY